MHERDLIVIGGGSAGLVASAGSAGIGARVTLIERDRLGGECLWNGCVPSKALLAAARAASSARRAGRFGIRVESVHVNFPQVMDWVRSVQSRIAPHDSPERFRSLGVEVVCGDAQFVGERIIAVSGKQLTAKRILIATGSKPLVPSVPGLSDLPYLTNETVFGLTELPGHMLVLGGGPIGLELAQAFTALGSQVTVLEMAPQLLPREDAELAALLAQSLADHGVQIVTGARVVRAGRDNAELWLEAEAGGRTVRYCGDALLVAAGRVANTRDLGLEHAGVKVTRDGIEVDATLRTSARSIWATGDVVAGSARFTHVADYQSKLFIRNAFFPGSSRTDYRVVPWVTFTEPELAHVGLTEHEATERYGSSVRVWRRPFDTLDRAVADGQDSGLLKVITNKRGRILGAHIIGYGAGTLIAQLAFAMKNSISIGRFASTIHAYPTYAEAIRHTSDSYYKAKFTGAAKRVAKWFATR